jgi:Ca2+:H+ antiporter
MDHRPTHVSKYSRLFSNSANEDFEIFQVAVIFVSVVMTNYLIMDGKSNWMEGVMLLGVYIIVAISYWLYPDNIVQGY